MTDDMKEIKKKKKPQVDQEETLDEEISFRVETNSESGAPVFAENTESREELAAVQDEAEEDLMADSHDDNEEDSAETDEEEAEEYSASGEDVDAAEAGALDGESLEADSAESDSEEVTAPREEGLALTEELTLQGKVEAIIFASPKPLRTVEIHELVMDQNYTLKEVQDALDELSELYRDRGGGFHLKYIKRMGYQFQTTPAAKSLMEKQFSSRPRPLSRAALETMAVIAYRQKINKGVTRAEVEFIRGVDAGSIFKTLVERNLLTCIGRKEIPGRPMMFGVTDEFLKVFQLGSINDLPPLESFQSPPDVIKAANDKIAAFEAEQEGVDPEAFIGDDAYTETLGENDFDILGATVAPYAPSLERIEEVRAEVELAELDAKERDAIPAEVLATMAQTEFDELTDADLAAAAVVEAENAIPKDIIEHIAEAEAHVHHAVDEMDKLAHDEIVFLAPTKPEREIEGASLAPLDETWDSDHALSEPDEEIAAAQDAVPEPEDPTKTHFPLESQDEKSNEG